MGGTNLLSGGYINDIKRYLYRYKRRHSIFGKKIRWMFRLWPRGNDNGGDGSISGRDGGCTISDEVKGLGGLERTLEVECTFHSPPRCQGHKIIMLELVTRRRSLIKKESVCGLEPGPEPE